MCVQTESMQLTIDVTDSDVECMVMGSCLMYGQVTVNGQPVSAIGEYEVEKGVVITLKNSHSFGRVNITTPNLKALVK